MRRESIIRFVVCTVFVALTIAATAEAAERALTRDVIRELEQSFTLDTANRALLNAVTNNDVKDLVYNRDLFIKHDDLFAHKIEAKGITDQENSGRCWIFAGFNIMRPAVMKRFEVSEFEFSENHLFFWDKLEKANLFLEAIIETRDADIGDRELQTLLADPIPDGGWWNYVVSLIEKYGAIPKEAMPETKNSSNTRYMNSLLNAVARGFAAELRRMAEGGSDENALRERKMRMLEKMYRILAIHLGVPPKEFEWRYEDKEGKLHAGVYTPLSFYEKAVGVDLSEYVTLFDHAAQAYDAHYRIKYCRNMPDIPDMSFVNVGPERLQKFALASVLDGEPVWFAADVGKENDYKNGIMAVGMYDYASLMGVEPALDKRSRILYRDTTPNHAMAFIGVDVEGGRPIKWLVENSWGTDRGNKGLWSMYNDWFTEYVYSIIVRKKYVSKDVLAVFETEPEILPAWDHMRSAFDR